MCHVRIHLIITRHGHQTHLIEARVAYLSPDEQVVMLPFDKIKSFFSVIDTQVEKKCRKKANVGYSLLCSLSNDT